VGEGRVAGVDWAGAEHAVCVVDGDGRIVEGRRYRHDERGIGALCKRLLELGVELVAVERPGGLLIERLLDAGLSLIAIHPNQVAAMRPRFSAAGGKSDGFDAFVLAELAKAKNSSPSSACGTASPGPPSGVRNMGTGVSSTSTSMPRPRTARAPPPPATSPRRSSPSRR
jgi:Transposase